MSRIKYKDQVTGEWVYAEGGGGSGGNASWGNITGTLSNQTDLQTELTGIGNSIHGLGNAIGMRGWNQLVNKGKIPSTQTITGVTFTNNGNGSVTINGTNTSQTWSEIGCGNISVVSDHKYYLAQDSGITNVGVNVNCGGTLHWGGEIFTASADSAGLFVSVYAGLTVNNLTLYLQLFDLTALFGSGNEPQTSVNFKKMFPADYYPYCSGSFGDLLWENASPTSAFTGQVISLDLSAYKYVLLVSLGYREYSFYSSGIIDLSTTDKLVLFSLFMGNTIYRYAGKTSNGITFDGGKICNSYGSASDDNNALIPYKIYGIR